MSAANLFDKLSSRIFLFLLACYVYSLFFIETWLFLSLGVLTLAAFELLMLILSKNSWVSARSLKRKTLKTLLLASREENLRLFARALGDEYKVLVKETHLVFFKHNRKCALFVRFEKLPLSDKDVVECARVDKNFREIYICCKSCDNTARIMQNVLESQKITIYEQNDVFELLKKHETYPSFELVAKPRFSRLFSQMFSARNIKNYLFCAGIILLFSVFSPLKLYYYIASGICVVLSLVCLIKNGRRGSKELL